ncbi:hypothetical protein ACSNN9_00265 [Micromonospora sp. URMC 107]|uniref:hypothetical protein n=1 Tax=Micromonospora sp. URMC 107 TaxID=3423418 RepID=UPI003F1BA16F
MIVVQRVLTAWTKRSRGAPGAVRRNAVAEMFRLPPGDPAAPEEWVKQSRGARRVARRNTAAKALQLPPPEGRAEVLVHQVVAREEDDFAVRQTAARLTLPEVGPIRSAGVQLEMVAGRLVVVGDTRVWCQCFIVFPPRPNDTVLRLPAGQWGRWRLNFRLWEDWGNCEWHYQKWAINVAHLAGPPPADLFQMTEPADIVDDMVRLSRPTRSEDRRILRSGRR